MNFPKPVMVEEMAPTAAAASAFDSDVAAATRAHGSDRVMGESRLRSTGELYPRVGFIVTNLARPAERVVAFYSQRGTAEQWIEEGKNAIRCTRLSCRRFEHNAVRLQLHALACNLGIVMRTLALPDAVEQWSLTSLREKLIKIGAKIVYHGRDVTFQMAEVVIPRDLCVDILRRIDRLRPPPVPA